MAEHELRTIDRRQVLLGGAAAGAAALVMPPLPAMAGQDQPLTRLVPSTGEALPIVGLGTWITFNVGRDPVLLDECAEVMDAFFAGGGQLIDSSPMYGSSQATVGYGLDKLKARSKAFAADKVWTSSSAEGPRQIETSRADWRIERFDLIQVHNLVAWEAHLDTLKQMKADGQLRYIGITTSHGRRHGDLERIMRREPLDFVQVTYNVLDRDVEERILPLAAERGIGVIVNRPYRRGGLIRRFAGKPLPAWVAETGAKSWAQFLLKFIISHPAVTCAIPATTHVAHVAENLAAARGPLPDAMLRQRMAAFVRDI